MRLHNRVNNEELKARFAQDARPRTTLSFYQYGNIPETKQFRNELYLLFKNVDVYGRIYVATEGVNGQISVPTEQLDTFKDLLYSIPLFKGIRLNYAIEDDGKSFFKLTIKVRDKIVADGLDDATFDASDRGTSLDAAAFNALADQADTIIVDMRNHYESEVGYFENAIRPEVATFRDALPLVEEMLEDKKEQPIIMYCTGGIRCEKASAYYKHKGFKKVYMVEGGIIEYARQASLLGLPNKFIGKNFVFDDRMGERISEDIVAQCHQCGNPCDVHINCANDACHLLFIQCPSCAEKFKQCCSSTCMAFNDLPEEDKNKQRTLILFNGKKFGKGRYKAFKNGHEMILS